MIYTVTLNPSIDFVVTVDDFTKGKLHYMEKDLKVPGGKGINVSRVLRGLNTDSAALGFLGGFTGNFISEWLERDQITSRFTKIAEDTRINIKLKSTEETEINGKGPTITRDETADLLNQLEVLKEGDILVLSGSKPPSLPADFYEQIIRIAKEKQAEFVIDTTGKALEDALPHQPLLIKPNGDELADLFNTKMKDEADLINYGKKLFAKGAQNVIISLAGDGAILITKSGIYRGTNPTGQVKNSVGAGDSMVAGFIHAYTQTKDPVAALQMGMAAGSATAFADDLATKEAIEKLLPEIEITQINQIREDEKQ